MGTPAPQRMDEEKKKPSTILALIQLGVVIAVVVYAIKLFMI